MVEVYALGGLEEEELRLFEAHLEECPYCQLELRELDPVVDHLLDSLPQYEVPKDLKKKVFDHIQKKTDFFKERDKKRRRKFCLLIGVSVTSLLLILHVYSAYANHAKYTASERQIVELKKDYSELKNKITQLEYKHKRLIAKIETQNNGSNEEKKQQENLEKKQQETIVDTPAKPEEQYAQKVNPNQRKRKTRMGPNHRNSNSPNKRIDLYPSINPERPKKDQPNQEPKKAPIDPPDIPSDKDLKKNNSYADHHDSSNIHVDLQIPGLLDAKVIL